MRIAVVGAGSWGTAMSAHLRLSGHEVKVWAREPEVVEGINRDGRNPFYLSDVELPEGIGASGDLEEALRGAETVVMAVPSRWTRETSRAAAPYVPPEAAVLNLAKGFDYETARRLSETIAEELGRDEGRGVAVLSGPNHAEEVARKVPSATVIASGDPALSRSLQKAFNSPYFRVYTNPDVIGVEVGGAFKNVIAIAAGVLDGLGLGDNTKASLITRGLAEMARFGNAMGANPKTFSGLSGIGDLIVTCISRHSRNRGFGERLGKGDKPGRILAESRMVVEGVFATRTVAVLAGELGVELPIADAVRAVIEEEATPAEMLERLMTRRLREETE
ncbi:MAG: NAD(P)-dependent glycerol-3-phosphate dehydrogenase [Actinobacteria bacterium]|nr:NAD(P)-dependent glycerol-3-phosphate dehydrogenase [Actinomycetota bacterium]